MKKNHLIFVLSLLSFTLFSPIYAAENKSSDQKSVTVEMFQLNDNLDVRGIGEKIGTITLSDTPDGLSLVLDLHGLTPGKHGFHMHQNPSCDAKEDEGKVVPGLSAGGHYDPFVTGQHLGPEGSGHMGDLPYIEVDKNGAAQLTLMAPRLTMRTAKLRSLVIHEGGDNYSDEPDPLGGGGPRVACGVIE